MTVRELMERLKDVPKDYKIIIWEDTMAEAVDTEVDKTCQWFTIIS